MDGFPGPKGRVGHPDLTQNIGQNHPRVRRSGSEPARGDRISKRGSAICLDEFAPLNLQPHPGRQWARRADCQGPRRRRRRATYKRPHGVRHLLAAYDLSRDRLYGHIKQRKGRTEFLAFCRYVRSLYPPELRLVFVLDNFSPHLTTTTDSRVGDWAAANNVELAYVPFYASWLNRIEAQFTGLRYFAVDGTDHPDHATQGRMIRRYIAWRPQHSRPPPTPPRQQGQRCLTRH